MSLIDDFKSNNTNSNLYWKNTTPAIKSEEKTEAVKESVTPSFSTEVRDEFVKAKKSNGLLRKVYDYAKNITGIGFGSKKLEKEVEKYEKGEITKELIDKDINKYKISQENGLQLGADLFTGLTAIGTFFAGKNAVKKLETKLSIGATPEKLKFLLGNNKKLLSMVEDSIKSKKAMKYLIPFVAISSGFNKLFFVQAERITSKEYKADKNLDKKQRKQEKILLRSEKRHSNRNAFLTGIVDGLAAPISAIGAGFVGVPLYVAGLLGLNYATNKHNEDKKSLNDFAQKLKDNAIINTGAMALTALPALKYARYSSTLEKNLMKVAENLRNKKLNYSNISQAKTAFTELEEKLLKSEKIDKILHSWKSDGEKILALTDENIFAVKFLQIKNNKDGMLGIFGGSRLSDVLQESCPPSRTMEQAQTVINKLWGSEDYQISKLLGVGTIAETYLAKDKTGKEVCIKILKRGINADKIAKDKEKFVQLVKNGVPDDKLSEETKYLLRNIDDLAAGISKEVDFVNEMNAAKELAKYTNKADVVKPIAAKNGIYVMEKAEGISVKTLLDYHKLKLELKAAQLTGRDTKEIEEKIVKIKSKSPDFEDFDITDGQIRKLLKSYFNVMSEQYTKIYRDGKVVHGDMHPGNMYINLNALKNGKGNLFTLIDTGNTITLSKEQSLASLKMIGFLQNGNYKDLTKIMLQDAVIPKGVNKEEIAQKIENDLKQIFFDNETKIDSMNIDNFNSIANNILRKYDIISGNTQLNLNKAKTSAQNSFENLMSSLMIKKIEGINGIGDLFSGIAGIMTSGTGVAKDKMVAKTLQETLNMLKMSPKEIWQYIKNPNNLKTNSVEHLTYQIKQDMPAA